MWNPFKRRKTTLVAPELAYTPIKERLNVPIDPTLDECLVAMKKEIAVDFREEAKEILVLASKNDLKDFLKYHKEDKGNICCLVLDKVKRDLIAEGKMERKDNDAFGKLMKFE